MAEHVYLHLESGLEQLEEMQRIKLFKVNEIKRISKKRKAFEYRVSRRNKSKKDFLQFIEFEICLLSLIKKRRKRLLVESKKAKIDYSIAKSIRNLFKAVVTRFPEDEKLLLNQIEFHKSMRWNESISELFTKLLQVHSKKPDLWILAAKWEMENNRSFDNARRLFCRGVLMNPKAEDLWREYFRMELKYVEMIRKRKEVLLSNKMEITEEENDAVMEGSVIRVVYDKAIEEIPDVTFALSFMKICSEFDFAVKHGNYILRSIEEKLPENEDVLDAVAQLPLWGKERIKSLSKGQKKEINHMIYKEIYAKYDEAVKKFPTEKMWNYYIGFLYRKLNMCKEDHSKAKIEKRIIKKLEEAAELGCLNEEHSINLTRLLLKRGEDGKALSVALYAAKEFKTASLWLECLLLSIKSNQAKEQIYDLLTEALSVLKEEDSIEVWKVGVNWLTISAPEKLSEFLEGGITKDGVIGSFLKEMYLEITALRGGIKAARDLYDRLKKMGTLPIILHQNMIKIENAQVEPSLECIRKCFECMIKDYGHNNVDVWIEFMRFEAEHGHDPESFNRLQWKGKKTLQPELLENFQTQIAHLLTGNHSFADVKS